MLEEVTGELRQAERTAYEKLIRVMSHEVNNTVASSTSLLQSSLTYARELSPDEPDRLRDRARRGDRPHRAAEHVHEGLRRRVPPAGAGAAACELVAILERWWHCSAPGRKRRRIAWRWELDAPAIRVSADPAQLEQAILNVVKNAVEAIAGDGAGGTITIRVASKPVRRRSSSRTAAPG